jgi:pilus assembly protein CpaF
MFEVLLAEERIVLTQSEKKRLFESITAEILGFGPLKQFLTMSGITKIMVNGPKEIFVERRGHITRTSASFADNEHLFRIIIRLLSSSGRDFNRTSPVVETRLPNGSLVSTTMPPLPSSL